MKQKTKDMAALITMFSMLSAVLVWTIFMIVGGHY